VLGSRECIYTHLDCIPSISSLSIPSLGPGGAGGVPGGGGIPGRDDVPDRGGVLGIGGVSGIGGILGRSGILGGGAVSDGGGAPVPIYNQSVCGFFDVPFWHGRQPSV